MPPTDEQISLRNFPNRFLNKFCVEISHYRITKLLSYFFTLFYYTDFLLEMYYLTQNFNTKIIVKYGCSLSLLTYVGSTTAMFMTIVLEKNMLHLVNEANSLFWPLDFCGLQVQKSTMKQVSRRSIPIYFAVFWFMVVGNIVVMPFWGDESEWLLCIPVYKEYFGKCWRVCFFLYSSGIPLLIISSVRLPILLICGILTAHIQIILINHSIARLSEPSSLQDTTMIDNIPYQQDIYKKQCFYIRHHLVLKRWIRELLNTVQKVMPLFIILGFLCTINIFFFLINNFKDATSIIKTRCCVFLICNALVVYMFAEAGQAFTVETSKIFDTLSMCSWYSWNIRNRKALLIFMANSLKPLTIVFAGITLDYKLALDILKTSFSYALVLYKMKM